MDQISQYWQRATLFAQDSTATRSYLEPSYDELGLAALEAARGDVGVVREASDNWGPEISQFLDHAGIDFPAAWCAAAVHSWLDRGARATDIRPPIEPTGGAQETMNRLVAIDRWVDRQDMRYDQIMPGMLMVWTRAESTTAPPDWRGHIAMVEKRGDDGNTIHTIEGNIVDPEGKEPQGVHRRTRELDNQKLFGFGVVSGPMPWALQQDAGPGLFSGASSTSWAALLVGGVVGFMAVRVVGGR